MHSFGHVEIPTTDFKKAKKFYGNLFDWTFQEVPEMKYLLFRTEEATQRRLLSGEEDAEEGTGQCVYRSPGH